MASEQQARRENTRNERDIQQTEKDRVPKITLHFESMAAEIAKETPSSPSSYHHHHGRSANTPAGEPGKAREQFESLADKFKEDVDKQANRGEHNKEQLSLEETSKLRQTAQQDSADALRAAEERYESAKEKASQGLAATTEHAREKGARAKHTLAEKGSQAKDAVLEKAAQAKDTIVEGTQKTSQQIAKKGSQAKDSVGEKAAQAKNTIAEGTQKTSQYAAEKRGEAKETAVDKSQRAKDTVASAVNTAKDYTEKAKEYTMERVAAAKDVTLESGKGAARYSGTLAVDVKDKEAVAGWTAVHYTTEKAVEGTKAAAKAVQRVAEYAGHKASELAGKPLGSAKHAAVNTGETMKEYTARKKEEAERELEVRKAREQQQQGGDYKDESQVHHATGRQGTTGGSLGGNIRENVILPEGSEGHQWEEGGGEGGVLGAIGETIKEIAHTTKELVIGQDQHHEHQEEIATDGYQKPPEEHGKVK